MFPDVLVLYEAEEAAMTLFCDVIWAAPERNSTTGCPYDVTVQLRARFQEHFDC